MVGREAEGVRRPSLWTGVVAGLAAALLWSGGSVTSRWLAGSGVAAADMILLRSFGLIAVTSVVALVWPAARPRIPAPRLAVLLLLGGPPYHALLYAGYGHAGAGAGSLLVAGAMPVFACLLGVAFRTPPAWTAWVGALAAAGGIVVFATGLTGAYLDGTGVLAFTSAAAMFALLGQAQKRWGVDPLQLTVAFGLWSVPFLPLWLWLSSGDLGAVPVTMVALQTVYQGVLVGFVATLFYFHAVGTVGPEPTGTIVAIGPSITAVLGATLLAEPLGPAQLAGMALVTLGLVTVVVGARLAAWLRRTWAGSHEAIDERAGPPVPRAAE